MTRLPSGEIPIEDRIEAARAMGEMVARTGGPNANTFPPQSPEHEAWQQGYDSHKKAESEVAALPGNIGLSGAAKRSAFDAVAGDTVDILSASAFADDLPARIVVRGDHGRIVLDGTADGKVVGTGETSNVWGSGTLTGRKIMGHPERDPRPPEKRSRYYDAAGKPVLNEAFVLGAEDYRLNRAFGSNPFGVGPARNADLSAAWERGWIHAEKEHKAMERPNVLEAGELIRQELVTRESVALAVLPFFLSQSDRVNTDMGRDEWAVCRAFNVAGLFMRKASSK